MRGHSEDNHSTHYDHHEVVGTEGRGSTVSTCQCLHTMEENTKWDSKKWLANSKVLDVVARALDGLSSNGLEYFQQLSDNEAEVDRLLVKASLQGLKGVIVEHLKELKAQDFATAHEQNGKFLQEADRTMEYGNREDFDGGLSKLIGHPNDKDPLDEMYREHNEYEYATSVVIHSRNYGIMTDMVKEWKGVAGMWTPKCQTFSLDPNFELPAETRGVGQWTPRAAICIYAFFPPSENRHCHLESAVTRRDRDLWWAQEEASKLQPEHADTIKQAQKAVLDANLNETEVLAVRLWSGPAYTVYNEVLRGKPGAEKKYMTTLHALCSAIFKLSKISERQIVFRGFSGKAITAADFQRGSFVERGSMSFTTNRDVALSYASGRGSARYVLEVHEGEIDKGADISLLSYYPHEKEKLYGPLCMMQVTGNRVDKSILVLQMRLNVNTKAGTLEDILTRRKGMLLNQAEMLHREMTVAQKSKVEEAGGGVETKKRFADRARELQQLRNTFDSEKASAFNDLTQFGDANGKLLRTMDGVWHHALIEPQLALALSSGDRSEEKVAAIRAKEERLKQLRTEQLKRWLLPRLNDLRLYRALRFHSLGWICYLATALFLFVWLLHVQLVLFVLRIPLETISAPISWFGAWLDNASTWCQRRVWAVCQAGAAGPSGLGMVVLMPIGGICLGLLTLLRLIATLLTTLSMGFLAKRLERLRGSLKVGAMNAQSAMGCLNQRPTKTNCIPIQRERGPEGGFLMEMNRPWLEAFWLFLPSDCKLLEQAAQRLGAAASLDDREQQWSDQELDSEVKAVQEEVKKLWEAGGVASKDALCGHQVSRRVRQAVEGLHATDIASKLRLRRLEGAVRCIKEACQTLPFSAKDVSPELTRAEWEVACKWGAQLAADAVCITGGHDAGGAHGEQAEHKPASALGGDPKEIPQPVKMRQHHNRGMSKQMLAEKKDDERTSKLTNQRSVERILELFEYGTCKGRADSEVVDTRHYDVWEARVLGRVSVVQEYMDAINLEQLGLEASTQDTLAAASEAKLFLKAISETQAAFLVHFIGENSLRSVLFQIGECCIPVRLEPRLRQVPPEDKEGAPRAPSWGTLLGLDGRICFGCERKEMCERCQVHGAGQVSLWLRPPGDMPRFGLTVDALRVLAEAAEYHFGPDSERRGVKRPQIRTVDVYYNSQIGGREVGGEGVRLLMRTIACIAPDVENLYLVYCGLGGEAMGELASVLGRFKRLKQLWLTFNPEATIHTHRLRKRWHSLKLPSRRLGCGPDWTPRTGLFVDFAGDVGVTFCACLGKGFQRNQVSPEGEELGNREELC